MAKIILALFTALCIGGTAYGQRQKSDRDDEGLRGAVRSFYEEEAKLSVKAGVVSEGKRLPSESATFDANGNFIERNLYDWAGNIRHKQKYSLASGGSVFVRQRNYAYSYDPPAPASPPSAQSKNAKTNSAPRRETLSDGTVVTFHTSRFKYANDAQGNRIEQINLREDGTPSSKTVNVYDLRGNRIAFTSYDPEGKPTFSGKSVFDERGNKIEDAYSNDGSGKISSKYRYSYEFDKRGNWIKRTTSTLVTETGATETGAERFAPSSVAYRKIVYEGEREAPTPVRREVARETAKGERVTGTRVRLVPPAGFISSARFSGYELPSAGASIVVSETPGSFQQFAAAFTDPAQLTKRDMNFLSKEDVRVADQPALLIHVSQTVYGTEFRKWILLFGSNPNESVLLVASFPKEVEASLEHSLKASLLSASLDRRAEVSITEGLEWTLAESGNLQIARRLSNMLIYTPGGRFPVFGDAPFLIVGSSLSNVTITEHEAFARQRILQTPELSDIQIQAVRPVVIDSLSGHEVIATARSREGNPLRIVQTTLPSGSIYYIIQGIVGAARADESAEMFRRMAASFKRR